MALILLLISLGISESSLETIFGHVLENALLDVPAGRSACFFSLGWDKSSDLQSFAMKTTLKVSFTHFGLQKSCKKIDVSVTCALNIFLGSKLLNLDELFDRFSFEKHSKFIVICSNSANSLNLAKSLQLEGITNVLFLEQIGSSVILFTYNLQLTERIIESESEEDIFPNKLSKLYGYPYALLVLLTHENDKDIDYMHYIHHTVLNFIITHQNASPHYRFMYEKSPHIFESFFDVVIPYFEIYNFENHNAVETVKLPISTEWCLVVPKVPDPQHLLILFRPFQLQLWIVIWIAYGISSWLLPQALLQKLALFESMKALAVSFCLFILCESYSAKLIAFLNAPIDTVYPKSLNEFKSSPIRLLIPYPEFLVYVETIPELYGKYDLYNQSTTYNWDQVAVIDSCNILEDKTVPEPQGDMGVVFSTSKYHVIKKPLLVMNFPLLFNKRSPLEQAARAIINRMSEVGLWKGLIKEQKREAGKSTRKLDSKAPDAFYGIMSVYRTMWISWILSIELFVLQWIYVKFFRQIHYNITFIIGLSVFLRY